MSNKKEKPNVIDLFAGCGGLSEGFRQAGFEVIAQVEMDKWACETLRTRCLYYHLKDIGKMSLYYKFLRGEIDRDDIFKRFPEFKESIYYTVIQFEFGKEKSDKILENIERARRFYGTRKFHVIIGGPPCQPYSLAGRARKPDRMENDNRHFLYEHYLKVLEHCKPDFFVFENVPGLMTARANGHEIFLRMLDDFRNISPPYEIAPSFDEYSRNPREYLLKCHRYGIPQKRKRVIFIGYKKSLMSKNPDIKNVFKKILKAKTPAHQTRSVSDAIGDLPPLKPGEGSDSWFDKYQDDPLTPYQRGMRKSSHGILNHHARTHMESDLKRYRFFIEHRLNGGRAATLSTLMLERPDLTPAHNHLDKFLDRFKVQWWDQPSSTITAHICKDGHYYIHPDISQCRSFTVREAARCQSFSDNFKFEGPRTEQFRQVGNAVPPLLAAVIARGILRELKRTYG